MTTSWHHFFESLLLMCHLTPSTASLLKLAALLLELRSSVLCEASPGSAADSPPCTSTLSSQITWPLSRAQRWNSVNLMFIYTSLLSIATVMPSLSIFATFSRTQSHRYGEATRCMKQYVVSKKSGRAGRSINIWSWKTKTFSMRPKLTQRKWLQSCPRDFISRITKRSYTEYRFSMKLFQGWSSSSFCLTPRETGNEMRAC